MRAVWGIRNWLVGCLLWGLCFGAGASLQLQGERASLRVTEQTLASVLALFEAYGVEVVLDPALAMERVTGDWKSIEVGRLVEQLAHPHDYVVGWQRLNTPLGALDQVSRIAILGEGVQDEEAMVERKRRTLDVVQGEDGSHYIRGEILVGFEEGSTIAELKELLRAVNGTVLEVIDPPGLYRIRVSDKMSVEEALAKARMSRGVSEGEPNRAFSNEDLPVVSLSGTPSGVNLNLQPGERAIAVFDSGIDPVYQNLPFMLTAYNAIDPGAAVDDPTGHGTLVSMIAAGAVVPEGMPANEESVRVLPVALFDANGWTSSEALFSSINYALEQGVRDFNWSFGTSERVPFFEEAIHQAVERGARIYISSGNDGAEGSVYPASSSLTISIGSGSDSGIAPWSNYGADVDAYYPGEVYFNGKRYIGTSFSAPLAAYLNDLSD